MRSMAEAGVPLPEVIEFGLDQGSGRAYTLQRWIEGRSAEEMLPELGPEELGRILALNSGILAQYEGMERTVPRWYRP